MRTTVTLDDDLATRLRDRAHERGIPFKAAINEAIRTGLDRRVDSEPYEMKPCKMGPPQLDLTKATQLAGQLEDEQLARRMQSGA
jgi:hypothetical protein